MNKIPKHISYNLAGTLTQLNQFEHYNKLIEKMIASSNPNEFNKEGIDLLLSTNQYRHEIVFPLIHRKSMFVSIFSFVERELFLIASLYEKSFSNFTPLEKIDDKGIDKAKTFFKENMCISIGKLPAWQKLKDYQSVRNFFVHNPYEAIRADHKSVAAFQRLNSINLTKYDLDDNTSSYSIEITSQLCLDLLDLAHSFFNDFYELLEKPK
ncbi:hypothetical protein ASG98_04585 [Bacillus sp. Soil531]|nr:hypothetical protein ASG98_04585 [Bacillus sp. Soil531]